MQAYQRLLLNISRAILSGRPAVPVVAPSMGWGPQHATPLCQGADSFACDKANMHSYPGGGPPINGLFDNINKNAYVVADRSRRIFATETGYHTATRQWPVVEQLGVDEETQGKYTSRLLLLYFAVGIERTFLYELLDQYPDANRSSPESDYGLIRNDWSYKPAAHSVKNLIALLAEPGQTDFAPPDLEADFDAETLPAFFNATTFGHTDGSFFVTFWLEATSYDIKTQTPIVVPPANATLRFSRAPAFARGELYRLSASATQPVTVFLPLPDAVTLPAIDEVCVLRLVPA